MGDVVNDLFDRISELICFPLFGDSVYTRGFLAGLGLALIMGWIGREYLRDRAKIQYFFKDVQPSLKTSPSGFRSMNACAISTLRLATVLIIIVLVIAGFLYAWSTP